MEKAAHMPADHRLAGCAGDWLETLRPICSHQHDFWSSKALIWNQHQGDLKWELSAGFAVHQVLERHPILVILMDVTNIQAWIRSTAYFVIQQVLEPHQILAIQMDVTSTVLTASIASIVDIQALEPHPTPVIQIGATKDNHALRTH